MKNPQTPKLTHLQTSQLLGSRPSDSSGKLYSDAPEQHAVLLLHGANIGLGLLRMASSRRDRLLGLFNTLLFLANASRHSDPAISQLLTETLLLLKDGRLGSLGCIPKSSQVPSSKSEGA